LIVSKFASARTEPAVTTSVDIAAVLRAGEGSDATDVSIESLSCGQLNRPPLLQHASRDILESSGSSLTSLADFLG
jgi:hypothetical protein